MGTYVHVAVRAPDDALVDLAADEVCRLEQLWSRFIATSEISQLNSDRGVPHVVSPETFEIVERAVDGWRLTGGAYDPTLLEPLVGLGYDKDFDEIVTQPAPECDRAWERPTREGLGITTLPALSSVMLEPGVGFDPGGIGKGLAADLVAARLAREGARGALVNIGGDMRGFGAHPRHGWAIDVENPADLTGPAICTLVFHDGAIASTTSRKRAWKQGDRQRHHLLDPRTGAPSETDVASVTVIADEGWRAEVLAKAAFLAGVERALGLLSAHHATGLVVGAAGDLHSAPGIDAYVRDLPSEGSAPIRS